MKKISITCWCIWIGNSVLELRSLLQKCLLKQLLLINERWMVIFLLYLFFFLTQPQTERATLFSQSGKLSIRYLRFVFSLLIKRIFQFLLRKINTKKSQYTMQTGKSLNARQCTLQIELRCDIFISTMRHEAVNWLAVGPWICACHSHLEQKRSVKYTAALHETSC